MLCVCAICRKVGGAGGSINVAAHKNSLQVEGKENISVYQAILYRGTPEECIASSERSFCKKCSSMLWFYAGQYSPETIYPFASVIDSPELPTAETMTICMAGEKPASIRLPEGKKEIYEQYPPDNLEEWHKKNNLYVA
ncbi:hypothetical protein NLJ89_g2421 [Agrocybe chaxingu]|uniref:CENP-V/GFA domain-containing protein n=1 Tax=Agrocybe chaxingu TaxID=84603 RepID=A0A9W8K7D0_9AGAR|nr:hypothetical protein NLJ89_g2421 [Agrocybe chaxingu]